MDEVIDRRRTRFEDMVHDMDLVFDRVSGERLECSPVVVGKGSRLVSVVSEPLHARANKLGIESLYFVVSPNREQLIEVGDFRPVTGEVFPLSKGSEAFEYSLTTHGVGKIVLRVADT